MILIQFDFVCFLSHDYGYKSGKKENQHFKNENLRMKKKASKIH